MSAKEEIGRLQDLLERVQARALVPRASNGGAYAAPAAAATPSPGYGGAPAQITPPMGMQAVGYEAGEEGYDVDADSDVEVSSEVVEVDIDIDEPMALESGAQPIANPTMPPEDLEDDDQPMETQPSHSPPMLDGTSDLDEATQTNMAAPANEIEEPTPSSSRRPIAGEEPAAEAYEEESAPRHTPPPESGKQVAAPSVNPPPARKPSVPPPSLEGHTLVGGWREPGLGQQPPPGGRGPTGTEPPATIQQGSAGVQVPPHRAPPAAPLRADVTKPDLAAGGANVATFAGAAPVAKPTTMGELLDMTLGL